MSKKHEGTEVEKTSILRQIRYEKRSIRSAIKGIPFVQMKKEHKPESFSGGLVSKLNTKKSKGTPEIDLDEYLFKRTARINCNVWKQFHPKKELILKNAKMLLKHYYSRVTNI